MEENLCIKSTDIYIWIILYFSMNFFVVFLSNYLLENFQQNVNLYTSLAREERATEKKIILGLTW